MTWLTGVYLVPCIAEATRADRLSDSVPGHIMVVVQTNRKKSHPAFARVFFETSQSRNARLVFGVSSPAVIEFLLLP